MNGRSFIFLAALVLTSSPAWTAPQGSYYAQRQPAQPREDTGVALKQIKTNLADLKYEFNNHEAEIRTFDEKLLNLETSHEQLREQLTEDVQSQKDHLRASTINLDGKIETLDQSVNRLDSLVNGLTADLRQMKAQANESVAVLAQYKDKLAELEKLLSTQSTHMQNLETALHSIMEVFQARNSAQTVEGQAKTYKVQSGDSLEKIARKHNISVQVLRDANQLTGDKIIVGQTLKIP